VAIAVGDVEGRLLTIPMCVVLTLIVQHTCSYVKSITFWLSSKNHSKLHVHDVQIRKVIWRLLRIIVCSATYFSSAKLYRRWRAKSFNLNLTGNVK